MPEYPALFSKVFSKIIYFTRALITWISTEYNLAARRKIHKSSQPAFHLRDGKYPISTYTTL